MASEIEGLKELNRQLTNMGQKVGGRALRNATNASMLPVLQAARAAAPVGTPPYESGDPYPVKAYNGRLRSPGFLKRNIGRKSFTSRDKTRAYSIVGPKPEAFYGTSFVELGTSKMAKQPWLEPAFRSSIGKVNSLMRAKLKAAIDKAAK